MSIIEYEEEAKIEGGIGAFSDVTEVVDVEVKAGSAKVPSAVAAKEYAEKVASVNDAQLVGDAVTAELVRL